MNCTSERFGTVKVCCCQDIYIQKVSSLDFLSGLSYVWVIHKTALVTCQCFHSANRSGLVNEVVCFISEGLLEPRINNITFPLSPNL